MAILLSTPGFLTPCSLHPSFTRRFYCTNCEKACCDVGAYEHHPLHAVVTIRRVPSGEAVRLDELGAFEERLSLPLKDIEEYTVDGRTFVFLWRRTRDTANGSEVGGCRGCGSPLLSTERVEFCSVYCCVFRPLLLLATVAEMQSTRPKCRRPRKKPCRLEQV
jgi:hypothetical protein